MMHGLRDAFEYFECRDCGCVQIVDFPSNLEKYYPSQYYSFKPRSASARFGNELSLLSTAFGFDRIKSLFGSGPGLAPPYFIPADLSREARILDVGSGNGVYLEWLYRAGFRNLHGIDPNLSKSQERSFPFRLEQAGLETLVARRERFAFVYLSHSLEHMPDQHGALEFVRELLIQPGGVCCIRIPWTSCEAWETYGSEWVQLDAPRHFYLHSKASFERLVAGAGFRIVEQWCDSTAFQFWGSEQYRRDIPLYSERSWLIDPERSIFTKEQIDEFERRARDLNATGRGDQIVAFLAPTP
jgi:SAM-dependent methyltransferase